ncbi:MAG: hypothetical protein U0414_24610 [Polyangiaceae bacterium]
MAKSDASNHGKKIINTHRQVIQLATTKRRKKLPYFEKKDKKGKTVEKDNTIETWKAAPSEICKLTEIAGAKLIHHETKIGHPYFDGLAYGYPSWYEANTEVLTQPPNGEGKKSLKVQHFAVASEKSPDVMAEGKWVVRDGDTTLQDAGNGNGAFVFELLETEQPDDTWLAFQQCTVSKLLIECGHRRDGDEEKERAAREQNEALGRREDYDPGQVNRLNFAEKNAAERPAHEAALEKGTAPPEIAEPEGRYVSVDMKSKANVLDVLIGDLVSVTAYRMNASETDPAKRYQPRCDFEYYKATRHPSKDETKHAVLVVSRDARSAIWGVQEGWPAIKDEIVLGGDGSLYDDDPESKRRVKVIVSRFALGKRFLLEAPEEDDPEPAHEGAEKAREEAEEAKREGRSAQVKRKQEFVSGAKAAVGTYQALMGFFFFQPLVLHIQSRGCSSGPKAVIRAFPGQKVELDLWSLKDLPFKKPIEIVKEAIQVIKEFLKCIKGTVVKGRGTADEAGAADASVRAGNFEISVFFFQRDKAYKKTGGQAGHFESTPADEKSSDDSDPKLALYAQYRELKKDVPEKKLTMPMVQRAWGLDIGIERLIGLQFKYKISLLRFGFIAAVALLIEKLGIEAGPYFEIDFDLMAGVVSGFEIDEYGEFKLKSGEVPLSAKLELKAFIQLGKFAEVGVKLTGEWKASFEVKYEEGRLLLERPFSEVHIKGAIYANYDIGIWSGELEKELFDWPIEVSKTQWTFLGEEKKP